MPLRRSGWTWQSLSVVAAVLIINAFAFALPVSYMLSTQFASDPYTRAPKPVSMKSSTYLSYIGTVTHPTTPSLPPTGTPTLWASFLAMCASPTS
jgi:hypothetical protein